MRPSLWMPLALLALAQSASADPTEPPEAAVSWRAGAFLASQEAFLTLGVALQLHTETPWTFEAAADLAVVGGERLSFDGVLGALPLSLAGMYKPLPDWPVAPFLTVGGGLNLISRPTPDPFLLGGGGALYQRGLWGVSTDLRFLFLPGTGSADLLDDRGLQMNLAIQRGF